MPESRFTWQDEEMNNELIVERLGNGNISLSLAYEEIGYGEDDGRGHMGAMTSLELPPEVAEWLTGVLITAEALEADRHPDAQQMAAEHFGLSALTKDEGDSSSSPELVVWVCPVCKEPADSGAEFCFGSSASPHHRAKRESIPVIKAKP